MVRDLHCAPPISSKQAMRHELSAPFTEAPIWAALRDCYHPQLRANIVELGLIHSVTIVLDREAPGAGVPGVPPRYRVTIGLMSAATDPASEDVEEHAAGIRALIENRLAGFPEVSRTDIEPVVDPPWTPDRIAPELRARVALAIASNHRPDALVQIQTNPVASRTDS